MPKSKNPMMQIRIDELLARNVLEDAALVRQVKVIKARFRRLQLKAAKV